MAVGSNETRTTSLFEFVVQIFFAVSQEYGIACCDANDEVKVDSSPDSQRVTESKKNKR